MKQKERKAALRVIAFHFFSTYKIFFENKHEKQNKGITFLNKRQK